MPKSLTVSIVIPVYNEESQLTLCLEAIARQTVKPLEVIVVDNNSTDSTVAVASRFSFVTVLHESQQGVVYARNRGFNAARGEIIGRLDGDSVIPSNWVERVQTMFRSGTIDAFSGGVTYRNVGWSKAFDAIDHGIRNYLWKHMIELDEHFLYGVNMALRRQVWQRVRSETCTARHLHEDQDLAAHLWRQDARVIFEPGLLVSISPRQAASNAREFMRYTWSNEWVYAEHDMQSRRYIWRIALFVSCLYPAIHLLYRGYNPQTARFSLVYLLGGGASSRTSPVSDSL
jgi:glycosyltransferase involved in cell wall biosynthesis